MKVDAVCSCGVLALAVISCSEGDDHCDSERAGVLGAIAGTGINGLQAERDTSDAPTPLPGVPLAIDALMASDGTRYRIDWHVGWRWRHVLVLASGLPGLRQRRARRLCNSDGSALWGIRLDVGTYCIQCRKQFVLRGYRQPLRSQA